MPCYHPISAFRSDKPGADGKRRVFFGDSGLHGASPIFLPCGRCIGCRLERSRQWAVRMMHEVSLNEQNCFLTLTYDDANIPSDHSLNLDHLQRFMKRYRKACGKLRFFACGEYGETTFRPHYHLVIFGHDFADKIPCTVESGRNSLWVSPLLQRLWPYGAHKIGAVTFESAAYVARYCLKKVSGEKADRHYERCLESTGEIVRVAPEFAVMSRRPGIGMDWFSKYGREVYPVDRVIVRGSEAKPPRYYDKLLEDSNPNLFEIVKDNRKSVDRPFEEWQNNMRRLPAREKFAQLKQRTFSKRSVE